MTFSKPNLKSILTALLAIATLSASLPAAADAHQEQCAEGGGAIAIDGASYRNRMSFTSELDDWGYVPSNTARQLTKGIMTKTYDPTAWSRLER